MQVQTYLLYNGRCQEALDFYQKAVGAEVVFLMHYNQSPEPCGPIPAGFENKVMHASFRIGDTDLMASDGNSAEPAKFEGFSLSLKFKTPEQAARAFAALGEGGQVQMPLMTTFFSPKFGMVADRFGVSWMVLVEQASPDCK
jgi:PhnB protein